MLLANIYSEIKSNHFYNQKWNEIKYTESHQIQVTTMLGQQLTKEEVEEFMKEADVDGNGKLDYDEFVKMMLQQ